MHFQNPWWPDGAVKFSWTGLRRSWTGTSRNFNKNGRLFIEKIIDYQEHSKLKIANADMDYKYLATAIEISRHGGGNY